MWYEPMGATELIVSSKASQEMSCLKGLAHISMPSRSSQDLRCPRSRLSSAMPSKAFISGHELPQRPAKLRNYAEHPKKIAAQGAY